MFEVKSNIHLNQSQVEAVVSWSSDSSCPARLEAVPEEQAGRQSSSGVRASLPRSSRSRFKRNPLVTISGVDQSSRSAPLASLSKRYSRLSLRIDVPHCEHGQLIGRGGSLQQDVKTRTGTDVHFPDSNKSKGRRLSSKGESAKSNRVALNGLSGPQPAGMEEARRLIRAQQPLEFHVHLSGDQTKPPQHLVSMANRFGVQLQSSWIPETHQPCWSVRTSAGNSEAARRVVEASATVIGEAVVTSWLRVELRHLEDLRGRLAEWVGCCCIRDLEVAVTSWFGLRAFRLRDNGEATVSEAGGAQASLALRATFLDCLPVSLSFEIPLDAFALEESRIARLSADAAGGCQSNNGVAVVCSLVKRGGPDGCHGAVRAVSLRSCERNLAEIYRLFTFIFDIQSEQQQQQQFQQPVSPSLSTLSSASTSGSSESSASLSPPMAALLLSPHPPSPTHQQQHQPLQLQQPDQRPRHSPAPDTLAPGAEYTRRRIAAQRRISAGVNADIPRYPDSSLSGQYFSRSCRSWAPCGAIVTSEQAPVVATVAEEPAVTGAATIEPFAQSCWHGQLMQPASLGLSLSAGDSADSEHLVRILVANRLADCIEVMHTNEIDWPTFLTLSDSDLKSLGLKPPVRERIRHLIRALSDKKGGSDLI